MADISDAETALMTLIQSAVYPSGTASPSVVASQSSLTSGSAIGASLVFLASPIVGLRVGAEIRFYGGTIETALIGSVATVDVNTVSASLLAPPSWNIATQGAWTGLGFAHASGSTVAWNDTVKILRGWPLSAQLDADLAAGRCTISVYSQPGMEKNTTRYPRDDQVATQPVHTLTATVSGSRVTIGGTVTPQQTVTVLCGRLAAFSYAVQVGDNLGSIATNVAALIPGASASGPAIICPATSGIVQARISSFGTTWTEQRRQERGIQIGHWCPAPTLRDALVSAVDLLFAQTDWIELPDLSACRVRYERTFVSDEAEKVLLFRRDLFFTVEYPTATTAIVPETATVGLGENISPIFYQ